MPARELGGGLLCVMGPRLLGKTVAARERQMICRTGRGSPLWKQSETGLQRRHGDLNSNPAAILSLGPAAWEGEGLLAMQFEREK